MRQARVNAAAWPEWNRFDVPAMTLAPMTATSVLPARLTRPGPFRCGSSSPDALGPHDASGTTRDRRSPFYQAISDPAKACYRGQPGNLLLGLSLTGFWTLTGLITDGTRGRPTRCCPGEIQLVGNRFRMDGQTNSSTAIERAMRLWCGEAMEHVSSSRFLGGGLAAED